MGLPITDCLEKKLYRALIAHLQADPTLLRVIKRWLVWKGDKDEDRQVEIKDLPYISITPSAGNANAETEGSSTSPLHLEIQVMTAGTNVDDLLNLWDAVRAALFPGDNTIQPLLTTNQAEGLTLVRAGYTPATLADGVRILVGSGELSANIWVQTRT